MINTRYINSTKETYQAILKMSTQFYSHKMRDRTLIETHSVNDSRPLNVGEVHEVHLSPDTADHGEVGQGTARHAAGLKRSNTPICRGECGSVVSAFFPFFFSIPP